MYVFKTDPKGNLNLGNFCNNFFHRERSKSPNLVTLLAFQIAPMK